MKREEEMWKYVEEEHGELSRREAMVALTAMEWSDETMIDKACKWLDKVNTDNYMDSGVFQMSELILDFKKAMKGE